MNEQRRCTATAKTTGERCKRLPVPGGTVCVLHGGAAPQVRAKAKRNLEKAAARRTVETYGGPLDSEPLEAMEWLLRTTAGHVAWLGALVAQLEHEPSTTPAVLGASDSGDGERSSSGRSGLKQYSREKGGMVWEKPSVWVELYGEERDRLARIAKDCLAHGIDERRVRVAEAQAQMLARAMLSFAQALGLDPGEDRVRAAMRRSLTVVAGGPGEGTAA